QSLERKSAAAGARVQGELVRLAKDYRRVRDIDFFDAPGGAEVRRLEEVITMRTRRPESARRVETPAPTLDLAALRGRRWVKRPRLKDRRLTRLAEVVHEADLRDGKYPHEEARGIDVSIRALLAASPDDHQVLAQGLALFEGLYATTPKKG